MEGDTPHLKKVLFHHYLVNVLGLSWSVRNSSYILNIFITRRIQTSRSFNFIKP